MLQASFKCEKIPSNEDILKSCTDSIDDFCINDCSLHDDNDLPTDNEDVYHSDAQVELMVNYINRVSQGRGAQAGVQALARQRAHRAADPVGQPHRARQDLLGAADEEEPRGLQPRGGGGDLQERHQGLRLLREAHHDAGVLAVPGELPLAQL